MNSVAASADHTGAAARFHAGSAGFSSPPERATHTACLAPAPCAPATRARPDRSTRGTRWRAIRRSGCRPLRPVGNSAACQANRSSCVNGRCHDWTAACSTSSVASVRASRAAWGLCWRRASPGGGQRTRAPSWLAAPPPQSAQWRRPLASIRPAAAQPGPPCAGCWPAPAAGPAPAERPQWGPAQPVHQSAGRASRGACQIQRAEVLMKRIPGFYASILKR